MLANILNAIALIADLEKVQLRCKSSRNSRNNEIVLDWRLQTKPLGCEISVHFGEGGLEASFAIDHLRAEQIFMFWDFRHWDGNCSLAVRDLFLWAVGAFDCGCAFGLDFVVDFKFTNVLHVPVRAAKLNALTVVGAQLLAAITRRVL